MTVRELLARTTSRELAEWMAFFSLEAADADEATVRARLDDQAARGVERIKARRAARR